MRAAGFSFIGATVLAVLLPWPLGLLPVAAVSMVSLFAVGTWLVDRRPLTVGERLDMHETLVWLEKMRAADVEAEWAQLAGETTPVGRPLAASLDKDRLHRVTRVPSQRIPGSAS